MANIFIEKFAITAISQYMMDCKVLVPYIDDNDKTPMWDGDIYIYKSEEINNENFKGRYPLQIKGTKITEDFAETTSYSVRINDLINYSHEGGCAFFVVQERWDEEEETTKTQIFHKLLSKDDINFLLKDKSDTQNTTTIHLSRVPKKKSEFVAELNRYLDIKLKYQEEADPIESKEDGWKPIQVIPLLNLVPNMANAIHTIKDEDVRRAIRVNIDSLLNLKYTIRSGWRDKVIVLTQYIINDSEGFVSDEIRAGIISNTAFFLIELNFYQKAEKYYNKALGIYKKLAEKDDKYMSYVADIHLNLGSLYNDCNEPEKSKKELYEALKINRLLSEKDPKLYKLKIVDTLNNIAALYYKIKHINPAMKALSEALEIGRNLCDENNICERNKLAQTLQNLGEIHKIQKDYSLASKEISEALYITRNLAESDPDTYNPHVAEILNNLAILHCYTKEYRFAEKEVFEALNINQKLSKKNPDSYIPKVTINTMTIANLYLQTNHIPKAIFYYKKTEELHKNLISKGQDVFLPEAAMNILNLALTYSETHDYSSATVKFQEALNIYEKLSSKSPEAYTPYIAYIHKNLALLHSNNDNKPLAIEEYSKALEIKKELAEKPPKNI